MHLLQEGQSSTCDASFHIFNVFAFCAAPRPNIQQLKSETLHTVLGFLLHQVQVPNFNC